MSKYKDFFIVALVLIFICSVSYFLAELRHSEDLLKAEHDTVKIWRDKAGRSNAELAVSKFTLSEFKKYNKNVTDSLRKELGIKPKNIKSVVTLTTTATDTVYYQTGKPFGNKWAKFNFVDSLRMSYAFKDSVALITHNKKFGFLNLRTKYVTRAITFNPYVTITGMTTAEIVPKQRRLSLSLFGGYALVRGKGGALYAGPALGVGFSLRLF